MSVTPVPSAWKTMPIEECNEPLGMLPSRFIPDTKHPYIARGAPYPEGFSPYMLRESVVGALIQAQDQLLDMCAQAGLPAMYIKVFDALRPNEVQKFMAERDARRRAPREGLDPRNLSDENMAFLIEKGLHWAAPSTDPKTPPPHSSGGTLDIYFVYADGAHVDMGTKVDSTNKRLAPMNAFRRARTPVGQLINLRRVTVERAFRKAGFFYNHLEHYHWDHEGTQRGAYMRHLLGIDPNAVARYGRADLVKPSLL